MKLKNEVRNLNEKRERLDKTELVDKIRMLRESKDEILAKQVAEFISLKVTEVSYFMTRGRPMTFLCLDGAPEGENLFDYDKKYLVSNKQVRLFVKNESNYGMALLRELKERFQFDQVSYTQNLNSVYEQVYFFIMSSMVLKFNDYLQPESFSYDKMNKTYVLNDNYHLVETDNQPVFGLAFVFRDQGFVAIVVEIFTGIVRRVIESSRNFAEVDLEYADDRDRRSTLTFSWSGVNDKPDNPQIDNFATFLESTLGDLSSVKKASLNFVVKKELLVGTVSFGARFDFTFIPHTLTSKDKVRLGSKADHSTFVFLQDNSLIKTDDGYTAELMLAKDSLRLVRRLVLSDSD